jgi:hypothetical protein
MREIGLAVGLGFLGSFAASILTFVLAFAGLPGSKLAHGRNGHAASNARQMLGFFAAFIPQSYIALCWVVLIVSLARSWTAAARGPGKWLVWVVAFWVATAPADYGVWSGAEWKRRLVTGQAIMLSAFRWTAAVATIAFFTFQFAPTTRTLAWGWVPQFSYVAEATERQSYAADRDRLTRVFAAFDSVGKLVAVPEGQSSMTSSPHRDSLVFEQLRRGLAAGDSISDAFLDWLQPEMRDQFRHRNLDGNRLYFEGLRDQDTSKQLTGIQKIQEWHTFWRDHNKQITDRALGS